MLIGGKYEVVGVLGEGGMGIVYEARQRDLDRRVAVKVLRGDAARDPEMVARFRREARVAASLTNPHVARILDFGTTDDGSPFMVLELLEGRDLQAEIDARGRLPLAEAVGILLEACEGVREAHARGVTHRDLKPGNVFLARQGGREIVKILDFGISKVSGPENERVTVTKGSFGTPLYMSPEQIKSARSVDHRTDVWALGIIFYEAVTGTPPFEGESASALAVAITVDPLVPPSVRAPGLSPLVDAIVARALAKDPAQRTPTVDALASELRRLHGIDDDPTLPADVATATAFAAASTQTSHATTRRIAPATPWRLIAGAVAAAIALVAAAVVWSAGQAPADAPARADDAASPAATETTVRPGGATLPEPDRAEPRAEATPTGPSTGADEPAEPTVAPGGDAAGAPPLAPPSARPPARPGAAPRPAAPPRPPASPSNVDARGRPTFL